MHFVLVQTLAFFSIHYIYKTSENKPSTLSLVYINGSNNSNDKRSIAKRLFFITIVIIIIIYYA